MENITWKTHTDWPDGTYWQAFKNGIFAGAVMGIGGKYYRHYYPNNDTASLNSNLVIDYDTEYLSMRQAAEEFYK